MNRPMYSPNRWFISAWYVAGALQSPIWITLLTMFPSGVVTAERETCSGTIRICSYASCPSIIDRYFLLATRRKIPSISGSGEDCLNVFWFRARRSTTVLNFPVPGLGIKSMGTVLLALVTCQRPEARYAARFSAHCGRIASGQRDGRQGRILCSLIRGIVWLIARKGGRAVSEAF